MHSPTLPPAVVRATYQVREGDLPAMVLPHAALPRELRSFSLLREGVLDNETMAAHGFRRRAAADLRAMGRITGYLREFGSASLGPDAPEGADVAVATVVHLFDDEQGVLRWMHEVFLAEFEAHRGRSVAPGQTLVRAERVEVEGLADASVAVYAVQEGPLGRLASTVVDFRVGRLLGVAYVVTKGEGLRSALAVAVGRELEKQIVRVVLGAA